MTAKKGLMIQRVGFLAFVAALGGILFGYDTAVVSGTTADVAARFNLDALSKGWYVSSELSRKKPGCIESIARMGRQCKDVSGG